MVEAVLQECEAEAQGDGPASAGPPPVFRGKTLAKE